MNSTVSMIGGGVAVYCFVGAVATWSKLRRRDREAIVTHTVPETALGGDRRDVRRLARYIFGLILVCTMLMLSSALGM